MPTSNGCAVLSGNEAKDLCHLCRPRHRQAIQRAVNGEQTERPMTHNLMVSLLDGFRGRGVNGSSSTDVQQGTFFARLIVSMENELGHKIVELDARPSDSIVPRPHLGQAHLHRRQGARDGRRHDRNPRQDPQGRRGKKKKIAAARNRDGRLFSPIGDSPYHPSPPKHIGKGPVTALAPMQDVTTLPFMRLLGQYGPPDLLFTEYFRVHGHSTPRDAYRRLHPRHGTQARSSPSSSARACPTSSAPSRDRGGRSTRRSDRPEHLLPGPKVYKKELGGGLCATRRRSTRSHSRCSAPSVTPAPSPSRCHAASTGTKIFGDPSWT